MSVKRNKNTLTGCKMLEKEQKTAQSNWGSEKNKNLSYNHGNAEPRGFGHIGIAVPDLEAACKLFEEQGVTFVKRQRAGKMKGLAFIQDPDGYWIEIFSPSNMVALMAPLSGDAEEEISTVK